MRSCFDLSYVRQPVSQEQPNNPLHGITLKAILEDLVERHGWVALSDRIKIRCFQNDPSIKSTLKFLRKTPWARNKVEKLYLDDQRLIQRNRERNQRRAARRARRAEIEATETDELEP
ncbi:MAG: VF530 family protein [Planctomycetota bacterium]|jgi:uncharacterized protein (DUF2132 family)